MYEAVTCSLYTADTHLDVDLKLITREPGRMPVGTMLDGAITHDEEDHFTFIQNDPEKKKVVVKPAAAAPAAAPSADSAAKVNVNNAIKAPLPGVVVEVKVAVGDEVKAGDTVVVLEAMKMANNLEAENDGKVTAVLVKEGDSVMEDTPLVVIE